jgi:hypothetical protein
MLMALTLRVQWMVFVQLFFGSILFLIGLLKVGRKK